MILQRYCSISRQGYEEITDYVRAPQTDSYRQTTYSILCRRLDSYKRGRCSSAVPAEVCEAPRWLTDVSSGLHAGTVVDQHCCWHPGCGVYGDASLLSVLFAPLA